MIVWMCWQQNDWRILLMQQVVFGVMFYFGKFCLFMVWRMCGSIFCVLQWLLFCSGYLINFYVLCVVMNWVFFVIVLVCMVVCCYGGGLIGIRVVLVCSMCIVCVLGLKGLLICICVLCQVLLLFLFDEMIFLMVSLFDQVCMEIGVMVYVYYMDIFDELVVDLLYMFFFYVLMVFVVDIDVVVVVLI